MFILFIFSFFYYSHCAGFCNPILVDDEEKCVPENLGGTCGTCVAYDNGNGYPCCECVATKCDCASKYVFKARHLSLTDGIGMPRGDSYDFFCPYINGSSDGDDITISSNSFIFSLPQKICLATCILYFCCNGFVCCIGLGGYGGLKLFPHVRPMAKKLTTGAMKIKKKAKEASEKSKAKKAAAAQEEEEMRDFDGERGGERKQRRGGKRSRKRNDDYYDNYEDDEGSYSDDDRRGSYSDGSYSDGSYSDGSYSDDDDRRKNSRY